MTLPTGSGGSEVTSVNAATKSTMSVLPSREQDPSRCSSVNVAKNVAVVRTMERSRIPLDGSRLLSNVLHFSSPREDNSSLASPTEDDRPSDAINIIAAADCDSESAVESWDGDQWSADGEMEEDELSSVANCLIDGDTGTGDRSRYDKVPHRTIGLDGGQRNTEWTLQSGVEDDSGHGDATVKDNDEEEEEEEEEEHYIKLSNFSTVHRVTRNADRLNSDTNTNSDASVTHLLDDMDVDTTMSSILGLGLGLPLSREGGVSSNSSTGSASSLPTSEHDYVDIGSFGFVKTAPYFPDCSDGDDDLKSPTLRDLVDSDSYIRPPAFSTFFRDTSRKVDKIIRNG